MRIFIYFIVCGSRLCRGGQAVCRSGAGRVGRREEVGQYAGVGERGSGSRPMWGLGVGQRGSGSRPMWGLGVGQRGSGSM